MLILIMQVYFFRTETQKIIYNSIFHVEKTVFLPFYAIVFEHNHASYYKIEIPPSTNDLQSMLSCFY